MCTRQDITSNHENDDEKRQKNKYRKKINNCTCDENLGQKCQIFVYVFLAAAVAAKESSFFNSQLSDVTARCYKLFIIIINDLAREIIVIINRLLLRLIIFFLH